MYLMVFVGFPVAVHILTCIACVKATDETDPDSQLAVKINGADYKFKHLLMRHMSMTPEGCSAGVSNAKAARVQVMVALDCSEVCVSTGTTQRYC